MILFIFLAILLLFLTFFLGLIFYARSNYGVLESLNIPVVKRSIFLGSTPDLHKKVQHLEDIERFKKYGPIYGVYEGRSPQVHVCSPELIRMILVKDFDYFHNRREVDLGNPLMNKMLDFIPVEPWRILRHMQTPALTTSKIKQMSVRMEKCVQEFMQHLDIKFRDTSVDGRLKIDGRKTFVPIAIDMLASGIFGIRPENPCDYDGNSFAQQFRALMGEDQDMNFMYTLSFAFPILKSIAPTIFPEPVKFFKRIFRNVIKTKEQGQNDFVGKLKEMMDRTTSEQFKALGIDEDTVLAQAIGPLLAGYDAIATTSTFLAYFLASNESIQLKVHEEIDNYFQRHGEQFSYENLNELEYLNACIKETLRLIPPFIRPERICTRDWEYNGVFIKKGCVVMVPAWAANRNPEIFHDPEKFDPERFYHDNNNTSTDDFDSGSTGAKSKSPPVFTFGDGPRNCIGMKLSYDALKMSLCHILKSYRFSLRNDTQIKYRPGALFLLQYENIYLDLCKR